MCFDSLQDKTIQTSPLSYKTANELNPWQEMIFDLVQGAGFSYSRIAYRLKVTPSTIQKLATMPERQPRLKLFQSLLALHLKVVQGASASPKAAAYWAKKEVGFFAKSFTTNVTESSEDDKWETLTEKEL